MVSWCGYQQARHKLKKLAIEYKPCSYASERGHLEVVKLLSMKQFSEH